MLASKCPAGTPLGVLANNGLQVLDLQTALGRTEPDVTLIPRLVKRLFRDGAWREFLTSESEVPVRWNAADFREFITSKRPEGCQTPLHVFERIIRETYVWEDYCILIGGEKGAPLGNQNATGANQYTERTNRDTITICPPTEAAADVIPFDPTPPEPEAEPKPGRKRDYSREAKTGTSVTYIVRRLLKAGRDDLVAKIKSGAISAYAASVAAGFGPRKITLPLDPVAAARLIAKHFKGKALLALDRELAPHVAVAEAEE